MLGLADLVALFPRGISADSCVEFDQVVVILDRAQFVFFAQFNRHQPGSPPEFSAMPFDVCGKLVNIRASIVRLDPLGVMRLIGAEGAKVRCLSGVEVTPLNVIGKFEGRYLYVAQLNVPLLRQVTAFCTIDGHLTAVGELFEANGRSQCGMAAGVNTPGGAACCVALASNHVASYVDDRAENSSAQGDGEPRRHSALARFDRRISGRSSQMPIHN